MHSGGLNLKTRPQPRSLGLLGESLLMRCEATYTLAQGEWAECFFQNLANSHRIRDSSAGKGIDVSLTDADTMSVTKTKIVIVCAEPADVRMGSRTNLN